MSEDELSSSEGADSPVSGYCSDASEIRRKREQIEVHEKSSLTNKIKRLSESTGIKARLIRGTWSVDDLKAEYKRISDEHALMKSIKFQRRLLLTATSGLEWAHNRSPLAGKLEGWSDVMMANIDDFDLVFERLHEKHIPRTNADGTPMKQMEPELELLYLVTYSAFTFGVTSSIARMTMQQASATVQKAKERTTLASNDTAMFQQATNVGMSSFADQVGDSIPTAAAVQTGEKAKVTLSMS